MTPNISHYKNWSIVDTAGFKDTCDSVRMMGVSYGLQALFDHLEEVKFILVITENELNDYSGSAFF